MNAVIHLVESLFTWIYKKGGVITLLAVILAIDIVISAYVMVDNFQFKERVYSDLEIPEYQVEKVTDTTDFAGLGDTFKDEKNSGILEEGYEYYCVNMVVQNNSSNEETLNYVTLHDERDFYIDGEIYDIYNTASLDDERSTYLPGNTKRRCKMYVKIEEESEKNIYLDLEEERFEISLANAQ